MTPAVEVLALGGPVAWLLAGLSVLAMALILARLWVFSVARPRADLTDAAVAALRAGAPERAARLCADAADPARRALLCVAQGRRAGADPDAVREAAAQAGENAVEALRAGLRPLELIAALAPLLGLFGTVLGMIDAFAAMEQAGDRVDPALLSGGIWKALLTTALGLGVAMPAVVAAGLFDRRIEQAERALDAALTAAFTPDLWQTAPPSPASARATAEGHDDRRVRPA